MRAALFGDIHSNWIALAAALSDARRRGAEALYCLGDVGGLGPHPDRSIELLRANGVHMVQGHYDDAIGNGKSGCGCRYADPRDDRLARIAYSYTAAKTSAWNRPWLAALPHRVSFEHSGVRYLLVHGSPRQQDEPLWESSTPDHLLEALAHDAVADVLLCSHTGLHWQRALASGRRVVNVGALGRPANDGRTCVWYAFLDTDAEQPFSFVPLEYDHERLARDIDAERLPEEFAETIRTGYWTACVAILPAKERLRGRF